MSANQMGRIKRIQYNCRHATFLIEKKQQTGLSLKERIYLLIHLAGCSTCRLFRKQSLQISRMMRDLFRRKEERRPTLEDVVKREMQEKINQRLEG